ncbi:MAG: double-strand break repair helicase AddA [Alphaproteobacteria bacterium]|nr:double-strand break repair helicase AddA [Alphaproteobacteria bacterium]
MTVVETRRGEQLRAANPEASVWVSASAGTGKTTVLTDRVLNLLLAGTPPDRILCLTFTKAAAAEMSERIAKTLGTWATQSDNELKDSLTRQRQTPPDDALMRAARRLFAAVLDVPGGMKIMTIHAFCQSVLKRFPLESGLAPHFAAMDERDAAELMDEARKELLARVGRQGGPLSGALAEISQHVSEDGFAAIVRELAAERARLAYVVADPDAAADRLRARLHLSAEDSADAIVAAACADGAFHGAGLRAAAAAMLEGGKKDQDHGRIIADWLAAPSADRAEGFGAYLFAFFTDKGTGDRRKRLIHGDAAAIAPDAEPILEAEARRLETVRDRLRAATTAAATAAVLRLGAALLEIYQAHKTARALLDYDDLILRTRDLFRRQAAAWVLYKLDGGIDHILIDEAQDTNPEQWEVVRAIAEEFFAGAGARELPRTMFAVGDPKQSIYSFQRAAPAEFEAMRAHFSERVQAAEMPWFNVPLEVSFRSTRAVLEVVDRVFRDGPARDGVVPPDQALRHQAHRHGDAGLVELWPPAPAEDRDEPEDWAPPTTQRGGQSPRAQLANFIAARIQAWCDRGEALESRDRPIRPGDVMVLVPRRGRFVEELVWALKQRRVPVAGVDRMVLTEQLPVMDLMALGAFLLLPEDDLTFAALLKSPLCGLSEDQLFALAHGRTGSLWQALRAKRPEDPHFARVAGELSDLLARADFVAPYELYADLLGARGGRRRLLARLGPEAEDPIDEFLSLALLYERVHTPSLQGFLHWVAAGQTEVKRELEKGTRDEVRVMTVHGAKGLQAPIVILPDTMGSPARLARGGAALLWPEGDDIPVWPPRREHEEEIASKAREAAARLRDQEHRRLLYVALTRAEDRLYVCGWQGRQAAPEDCWYNLVAGAMSEMGTQVPDILAADPLGWGGPGWRYAVAQTVPAAAAKPAATAPPTAPPPDWLRSPAPPEPAPPRPLAPSRPTEAEPSVRSPLLGPEGVPDDGARFRRGLLIHRLLQSLPEAAPEARPPLARRYLDLAARDYAPEAREEIASEVLAVLEEPDFAPYFGPGSRAEVPLSGVIGEQVISGQVDRLVLTDRTVAILDYKSNRPAPRREDDVSAAYLRQMAAYRALLRGLYPERAVRCALLWTDGPRLMPLGEAILDRYAP